MIWTVQVDPDFCVRLCGDCHVFSGKSAHDEEKDIRDKIVNRIGQADPDRAVKVSQFLISPHNTPQYRRSQQERPLWDVIGADLIMRLEDYKEQYHIDMANVDEVWRGRPND